jgi:hypothetical protein
LDRLKTGHRYLGKNIQAEGMILIWIEGFGHGTNVRKKKLFVVVCELTICGQAGRLTTDNFIK